MNTSEQLTWEVTSYGGHLKHGVYYAVNYSPAEHCMWLVGGNPHCRRGGKRYIETVYRLEQSS